MESDMQKRMRLMAEKFNKSSAVISKSPTQDSKPIDSVNATPQATDYKVASTTKPVEASQAHTTEQMPAFLNNESSPAKKSTTENSEEHLSPVEKFKKALEQQNLKQSQNTYSQMHREQYLKDIVPNSQPIEITSSKKVDTNTTNEIKTDAKIEAKIIPKTEPKIEQMVEIKNTTKLETKAENIAEVKIEPKTEPKLEAKIESSVENTNINNHREYTSGSSTVGNNVKTEIALQSTTQETKQEIENTISQPINDQPTNKEQELEPILEPITVKEPEVMNVPDSQNTIENAKKLLQSTELIKADIAQTINPPTNIKVDKPNELPNHEIIEIKETKKQETPKKEIINEITKQEIVKVDASPKKIVEPKKEEKKEEKKKEEKKQEVKQAPAENKTQMVPTNENKVKAPPKKVNLFDSKASTSAQSTNKPVEAKEIKKVDAKSTVGIDPLSLIKNASIQQDQAVKAEKKTIQNIFEDEEPKKKEEFRVYCYLDSYLNSTKGS